MSSPSPQPPTGGPATAAFLLAGLGRIVRDEIETELRAHGLTLRHLSALGHLSREPGLSYSELARRAGVTVQSMQATLRQLEDDDAVERVTPTGRGRTAQLRLTAAGNHLLTRGRQAVTDVDDRLFAGLGADEHSDLARLLTRAYSSMSTRRTAPPANPAPTVNR